MIKWFRELWDDLFGEFKEDPKMLAIFLLTLAIFGSLLYAMFYFIMTAHITGMNFQDKYSMKKKTQGWPSGKGWAGKWWPRTKGWGCITNEGWRDINGGDNGY